MHSPCDGQSSSDESEVDEFSRCRARIGDGSEYVHPALRARDSSSAAAVGSRRVTLSVAVAGVKRKLPPGLETPGGTSFEADAPDDASSCSGMEGATLLRQQTSAKRRKTLARSSDLGVDGYGLGA